MTWSALSFIGVEFMASYFYSSNASQRSGFYSSSAFDGYVDAARTTLNEDEAKEGTIAADRQLVRTDFATIPVVWPKTPYVLREGYDGLSILVNFHYKDMSKSAWNWTKDTSQAGCTPASPKAAPLPKAAFGEAGIVT